MKRALTLLVFLATLHGAPVAAQGVCYTYDKMAAKLGGYGETIQNRWTDIGLLFEFWASDANGTWSIIRVYPERGVACMARMGKGWEPIETEPKGIPT